MACGIEQRDEPLTSSAMAFRPDSCITFAVYARVHQGPRG
jgi:hypothetical protein